MSTADYQPFPLTHWSLVRRAGGEPDNAARQAALADLLARYAPALRSYLLHVRRLPADEADDLLQAFIVDRMLASELLRSADAARGRFRTLLLTSLNHFATSRYRARRRHAAAEPLEDHAENTSPGGAAPGAIVEAAWARQLVHRVIGALRAQCERTGRMDVWAVFEGRILAEIFDGQEPVSYEALAAQCDLHSPAQAANLLVTAKRSYARLLRETIAEYEREAPDIEAELADLRQALERGGLGVQDAVEEEGHA